MDLYSLAAVIRAGRGSEVEVREREDFLRVESILEKHPQRPLRTLHFLYHELRPDESQYSYAITSGMFQRHMDLFAQTRSAKDCTIWPEVTFDDGHISNLELAAPILQARGMTAFFFITAGWTGNKPGYMGWAELRALHKAGHSIGAHGWSHKLLTHCSDDELMTELSKSRLTLEDKLGTSIPTMSLPGGRSNRHVLDACTKAGYSRIYTSIPRAERNPLGTTIGRVNVRGTAQPEWIAKLFDPDGRALSELSIRYRMKETAQRLLGDRLYARLWAIVNRHEAEPGGEEGPG